MRLYLDWPVFKINIINKGSLRYEENIGGFYKIWYGDFDTTVLKDSPANPDQTDFETNYMTYANKSTAQVNSPFDAKTDGVKKLFARSTGRPFAVGVGTTTCDFTIPYTVCKITGLELINAEVGDYCDFFVVHPIAGVLGQFGYTNYLSKDFYSRVSKYDADLAAGLILRTNYYSVSAKNIYVNYLLHEVV